MYFMEAVVSVRTVPVGKADIVVRMSEELKAALMRQAHQEHRSLPNLIQHASAVYLERVANSKGVVA